MVVGGMCILRRIVLYALNARDKQAEGKELEQQAGVYTRPAAATMYNGYSSNDDYDDNVRPLSLANHHRFAGTSSQNPRS